MPLGRLVFVTGNAGKLDEVREILAQGEAIDIESRDFDLPEIQGTTQEIATEKCRRAAEIVGGPVITEDTALCFAAMNGLPGPYIKFFLRELGFEGINRMLDSFTTRAAWALCTFAYSTGPGTEPVLFEGRTDGRIVPPRGTLKFGLSFPHSPCGAENGVAQDSTCMWTDGDENAIFAATRRWMRYRNMQFPTGDGRCKSYARTY